MGAQLCQATGVDQQNELRVGLRGGRGYTGNQDGLCGDPSPRPSARPAGRAAGYDALVADPEATPDSVINVVLYFDEAPLLPAMRQLFVQNVIPLQRFQQRLQDEHSRGTFDDEYHFAEEQVSDERALDLRAQELVAEPLDISLPLWRLMLLQAASGRSALLFRVHSCIADGLGLLFDLAPTMEVETGGSVIPSVALPGCMHGIARKKPRGLRSASSSSSSAAATARNGSVLDEWLTPMTSGMWGLCMPLCAGYDADLRFNESRRGAPQYSGFRQFVRFPPLELDRIKDLGKAFGGASVNDIALAVLTGAWRRYGLEVHRDPRLSEHRKRQVSFKALMPVAQPPETATKPARHPIGPWVYASVPLPLGEPEATLRVREVCDTCDRVKNPAYGASTLFLDMAGKQIGAQRHMQGDLMSKHSLVIANCPGPGVPVKIAGEMVQEIQLPCPGTITQIYMISYSGFLCTSMMADPAIVPEPEAVGACFGAEFDALESLGKLTSGPASRRKKATC